MNHGKYMMKEGMHLRHLKHTGTSACTCRWNLFHIFLHGDWYLLLVDY
jgi:hypothetical protein